MGTQPCPGSRRIRLYGVSLVKITFIVKLFEQPPYRFYVSVVICDIRVVEIHPITHLVGEISPFLGVFHHLMTAGGIVFVYGNLLAYVFLGDSQSLLNAQLHREAMGVPAGLALYLEAPHGLVAACYVFYGTGHHMMYTRHSVGRRRPFVENERGATFALGHARFEKAVGVPYLEHLLVDVGET